MRFSTLLLAAACAAPFATAQTVEQPVALYVANQGGFGANTSSLTLAPGQMLFEGEFGSTIQSITLIGDRLYVMSDEAGRIDVIDVASNSRVAQISSPDMNSARYMAEAGLDKAYVTQLYLPDGSFSGGSVAVIDLATNTVTDMIYDESFSNPEGIAVVDGLAFVANSGFGSGTTLTVISTLTDTVLRVDEIGCAARAVLPDAEDAEVYAFCDDEIVAVTAAVTPDGDPGIRSIPVPESVRPLGTGGLGQDAAALTPDRGPTGAPGGYFPSDMAAVGTGGVLLINSQTDEVQAFPIEDERPIGSIGYGSVISVDGDAIETRLLHLGFADADNPFSADGSVADYFVTEDGLEGIAQTPAGVYPTSMAIATTLVTGAEPGAETDAFALTRIFPNPAAGRATAAFTLGQAQTVRVRVFDVLGREVLADERAFAAGAQQVDLDAAALRPGLYVVRLEAGTQTATARFTVAR